MKILVLSSYAPSLISFRAEMMEDMISNGHEVIAAAPEAVIDWKNKFDEIGVKYIQIDHLERTGINPLKDFSALVALIKIIYQHKPDKIFTYQAKTIVYGAIAARANGIKEIYALIGGLGSVFRNQSNKNILKKIIILQYKIAMGLCKKIYFQNKDDVNAMKKYNLVKNNQIIMINGSGVNLKKFRYKEIINHPVFLFVGRIIRDKGIFEYIESAKIVKSKYPEAKIQIVGFFDSNPSAIFQEEIQQDIDDGTIEFLGRHADVTPYLENCSVFVLPSYHEGTPKSVLEAMAVGRPIITTDSPGCKETVIDGVNGFLVPVKNSKALAEKMIWTIENQSELIGMGKASLKICRNRFDVIIVNNTIMTSMGLVNRLKNRQEILYNEIVS